MTLWGNGGLNIRFYVRNPKKAHPCTELRFGKFCIKIRPAALAAASCKNPPPQKKKLTPFGVQLVRSHAWAKTKPLGQIVTNFCIAVGIHDVITSDNFYDCCTQGFGVVGVKLWASPLTCIITLTTLSYSASVSYKIADKTLLSNVSTM